MEASDIHGECKLCLQAVSTANLELTEYGHSFLEQLNDYEAVIHYFRGLNSFAASVVREVSAECKVPGQMGKTEYVETIKEGHAGNTAGVVNMESTVLNAPWITDIALLAAIRLFAQNGDIADRAYQYCKTHL